MRKNTAFGCRDMEVICSREYIDNSFLVYRNILIMVDHVCF
jgi:hypothetical protein